MSHQLTLKRFSMDMIEFKPNENKGPVIVMIGRRGTGKSFLIQDLMYNHRSIPIGTVMSGTEIGNGYFSEFVPKILVHDDYSTGIVEGVFRRQKAIVNRFTREMKTTGNSSIDPRLFLIMDDCLYDDSWCREKIMRLMFMNGRHWKVMLIITMQYPLGIPPALRSNVDFAFIMREPISSNRKRIWINYASMFPTFESFCTVLDQTTENYECMVIRNTGDSNKISDMVFWYKAVKRPRFRLTTDELWQISEQIVENDDDNNIPELVTANISKRSVIQVKKV